MPFRISSFVPKLILSVILPGTAYTVLPCSNAQFAVIIVPLFSPASTTSTPQLIPLIILFLIGKKYVAARVKGRNSLITQPFSIIASIISAVPSVFAVQTPCPSIAAVGYFCSAALNAPCAARLSQP